MKLQILIILVIIICSDFELNGQDDTIQNEIPFFIYEPPIPLFNEKHLVQDLKRYYTSRMHADYNFFIYVYINRFGQVDSVFQSLDPSQNQDLLEIFLKYNNWIPFRTNQKYVNNPIVYIVKVFNKKIKIPRNNRRNKWYIKMRTMEFLLHKGLSTKNPDHIQPFRDFQFKDYLIDSLALTIYNPYVFQKETNERTIRVTFDKDSFDKRNLTVFIYNYYDNKPIIINRDIEYIHLQPQANIDVLVIDRKNGKVYTDQFILNHDIVVTADLQSSNYKNVSEIIQGWK